MQFIFRVTPNASQSRPDSPHVRLQLEGPRKTTGEAKAWPPAFLLLLWNCHVLQSFWNRGHSECLYPLGS
ncbi:Protein Nynrin [Manis pentadactyla]|nr:Protein Nynrin [Manis pentadactyla]